MNFSKVVFLFLIFLFSGVTASYENNLPKSACSPTISDSLSNFSKTFYPKSNSEDQIIKHFAYSLCYDEKFEQARWVAYHLTSQMCLEGLEERTNNFRNDPLVNTGSAHPDDYKKTGYDRGHLCPAGDMSWNDVAMSESFYMSNMSPQKPKFNRGIWKSLETQVREWAKKEQELYIVTAAVLTDGLSTIGVKNKVAIPNYYYKIVLDVFGSEKKAIAFVMPNEGSAKSVFDYAVTIDSVEQLTQIDFFPSLPNEIENDLESRINIELWRY